MADRHNRDIDRPRAPLPEPLPVPTVDAHAHMEIVTDAAFAQRRKMLRSALSSLYGSSSAAEEILVKAGIDPTLRGEALQVESFCKIAAVAPDIF